MILYTGNRLQEYIQSEIERLKNNGVKYARFCQKDLKDALLKDNGRVCGIYGLRRTGKSTMIKQTIAAMDYANTVFIQCTGNDNYIELERVLDSLPQKYIFIDEITKADKFMQLASSLSDKYGNKNIVITGTDSAELLFIKQDELYDRIDMIHTTYISYAEYNYLLGKSLEEYIRYGGTLTDGKTIYNSEENLEEYTNSAIISNVCKSVKVAGPDSGYRRLYSLYQSGDLESAINKTIEKNTKEFSLRVMTGMYNKSALFGSVKDLTLKQRDQLPDKDVDTLIKWKDHTEICDYIIKQINLNDSSGIMQSDIDLITRFLVKLDVLSKLDNEITFTQPGMQYCFAEALMNSIVNTHQYQALYPETQRMMLEKISQDSIGHILENVIRTDVLKCPQLTQMEVGRLDHDGNGEFDLYIINPDTRKAAVYEIKRSSIDTPKQYQYLIDKDFCDNFERVHECKIVEKAVLYQGDTKTVNDCIHYYNAAVFLENLDNIKQILSKDVRTAETEHQATQDRTQQIPKQ